MMEDVYLSIETDPLDATYTFRLPRITENKIKALTRLQRKELNEELLKATDRFLYIQNYKLGTNLKSFED